jgi:hypothetical protein
MRADRLPLAERFWHHVRKCALDGCWEWHGAIARGYGHISEGGRRGRARSAHRVSWELHHGPIPSSLYICHRWDNRRCVRPDHLFLGTHADNMRDMLAKGRHIPHLGEVNGRAKLTRADVVAIRSRWRSGVGLSIIREWEPHT